MAPRHWHNVQVLDEGTLKAQSFTGSSQEFDIVAGACLGFGPMCKFGGIEGVILGTYSDATQGAMCWSKLHPGVRGAAQGSLYPVCPTAAQDI